MITPLNCSLHIGTLSSVADVDSNYADAMGGLVFLAPAGGPYAGQKLQDAQVSLGSALALTVTPAPAEKKYGPGVTEHQSHGLPPNQANAAHEIRRQAVGTVWGGLGQ